MFEINFIFLLGKVRIKRKSKESGGNSGDKNRIKFVITSKNFSKTFQFKEISFDIIALFVKLSIVEPMGFTIFLVEGTTMRKL